MIPGGALYGPGAERLIPSRSPRLNRYAEKHNIPLISTTDAHPENAAEFKIWPPHCVAGTFGQQKPCSTLLAKRTAVVLFMTPFLGPAPREWTHPGQIIIQKKRSRYVQQPLTSPVRVICIRSDAVHRLRSLHRLLRKMRNYGPSSLRPSGFAGNGRIGLDLAGSRRRGNQGFYRRRWPLDCQG